MKVSIPNSKLEKGIELGKVQAKLLLDSSEILCEKRKYVTSISLAILAKEELTKIRIFNKMLTKGLTIENDVWQILTDHRIKLSLPYYQAYERLRRKSLPTLVKLQNAYKNEGIDLSFNIINLIKPINIEHLKFLQSLDLVKQDCQFLNWINNDWYSILNNYNINLQKAVCYTIYYESLSDYLNLSLSLKYKRGDPIAIPKTITGNKLRKVLKYMQTDEFKKIRKFAYETIQRDYKERYEDVLNNIIKRKRKTVNLPL